MKVACRTCARGVGECCVDDRGREIDYVHEARVTDELLDVDAVGIADVRYAIPVLLVACPACAQQPHEACVDEVLRPLSYVHGARIEEAVRITAELNAGRNVAITDQAIERTGLV